MTLRFGTDGVRGVANVELTTELVLGLGRAAARVLGTDAPFIVGRDTRRSGPMVEAALVAGLCAEGADVELVGILPTPGVAALAAARRAPAAMISASHNPFPDNGVKLFAAGGRKLTADAEARVEMELGALIGSGPIAGDSGTAVGTARLLPGARDEYVTGLVGALAGRTLDGLRVVLDCGHGAAFEAAPEALRRLGADVEVHNVEPDGTNINAGCGSTDPSSLRAAVVASGAHAGLAFDGDADRVIAIDEHGDIVDGDHLLCIAAIDLASRDALRGNAVVVTVMSNLGLRHALTGRGIEVVETPVGDRHVISALDERGLALGGEQSGHIIFADYATTGDGTLTGIMLLDVMARTGRPLSALAAVMTSFPQVLRNVRVADRATLDAAALDTAVAASVAELGDDGRVLVRPSGTEPVVRVMVEAASAGQADLVAARLVDAVEQAYGRPATS
jgi:phosphoglucosamine mutase